jgi:hypothetical protein
LCLCELDSVGSVRQLGTHTLSAWVTLPASVGLLGARVCLAKASVRAQSVGQWL